MAGGYYVPASFKPLTRISLPGIDFDPDSHSDRHDVSNRLRELVSREFVGLMIAGTTGAAFQTAYAN